MDNKKDGNKAIENEENVGSLFYTFSDILKTIKAHFLVFITIMQKLQLMMVLFIS